MVKIQADDEVYEIVKERLQSDIVLPFVIEEREIDLYGLVTQLNKLEYAKAISSFIEEDESLRGVYQDHDGNYHSLNSFFNYDIAYELDTLDDKIDDEYDCSAIYFTRAFSTQGYRYCDKKDEKFLMSICSEGTEISRIARALCLGDNGSLTFAIDEKLFKDKSIIEVTDFNGDCY